MNKPFIILVFFLLSISSQAQYLTPYLAAGASENTSAGVQLTVSIGQLMPSAVVKGEKSSLEQGILSSGQYIQGNPKLQTNKAAIELDVYPNPVINIVYVNVKDNQNRQPYRVQLYDSMGRRVASVVEAQISAYTNQIHLNLENEPPGHYLIRVIDEASGNAAASFKIVKKPNF